MNSELKREYQKRRAQGYRASHALYAAHIIVRWGEREGYIEGEGADLDPIEYPVRLRLEWDDMPYDDSYIDTWTDVRDCERERYRADLWSRIERNGVVGVIGEFWDGAEWQHADSCWGFVGDDWKHMDVDIMGETLAAHDAHLIAIARAWEASRPDMYQGAGS